MANFFSADYWKALYFKAMGGQATAVDPNAMRGTFAGVASFTGTADATGSSTGNMAGSFAGSASFTGDLRKKRDGDAGPAQGKKRRINIIAPSLQWARDNLERFLGPKADTSVFDAPLEKESASASTLVAEPSNQRSEISAAETQEVVAVSADEDEDEIIALLLAA